MARLSGILILLVMVSAPAAADEPTFESLWQKARAAGDCVQSDKPDYTLLTCNAGLSFWYFTKPNHPAHPAVVSRVITLKTGGGWSTSEHGNTFSGPATQPAFQTWFAQIRAQDRDVSAYLATRNAGGAANSSN